MIATYDIRPGELAVRASRRVACSSPLRADVFGRHFIVLLDRGVVYLLDELLAEDFAKQDPRVVIVPADRGSLPAILQPSERRDAQRWMRGELRAVGASR